MKINFLKLSALLIFAFFSEAINAQSRTESEENTGTEAGERYEWEMERLKDPVTGKIPDYIRQKEVAFAATLPSDASFGKNNTMAQAVWDPRGPYNVGGRTRAFAIDVTNENIMMAGSVSGALWRSTDGGATWNNITPPSQYHGVTCIAQDVRPGKTNIWYYGTGEGYGQSASVTGAYYQGNGVYKSTDGGLTWSILPATSSGTPHVYDFWDDIWAISLNPADLVNDVVYVATTGYIYKSVNGGTSWTVARGSGTLSYYNDVKVSPAGVVYATQGSDGSQKGIFRSTDGVTFTNITPAGFPPAYRRIVSGICPQDEKQVYFLAHTPNYGRCDSMSYLPSLKVLDCNSLWKYTYLSGDGSGAGGKWENLSNNIPRDKAGLVNFNAQGSYDMAVAVKPDDSLTVFICGTNIFRSRSGFRDTLKTAHIGGFQNMMYTPHAIDISYPNHHSDQHVFFFLPSNPNIAFTGNDGGLAKANISDSVVTWTSLNNGYVTSQFYTLAIDHGTNNSNVIVGGLQDNGTFYVNSTNASTPWTHSCGGDGSTCAITDGGSLFYLSNNNGPLFKKSLDANGNQIAFARINPIGGTGYLWISPFVLDPNNQNIMYLGAGRRLWRNHDLSQIPLSNNTDTISTNWTLFPDSLMTAGAPGNITSIAISKTPANRLYLGSSRRDIFRIDNANTGTPTPVNLYKTPTNLPSSTAAYVSCIAVDPRNANKIMVTYCNYNLYSIFYTTGADSASPTWQKVAGNLEQNVSGAGNGPSVRWASIIPVSDGTVFMVATSTGIYATDSLNGVNTVWVQQGSNTIGNVVCDMIDYRTSDGLVVVATHGQGMYSTHITSKVDILGTKDVEKMEDFDLTNYPNPLSSNTTIEFNTKRTQRFTLKVYDELGRTVQTLLDEEKNPGRYRIPLNASAYKSGIYYYSLETPDARVTRKMVVQK